MRSAVPWRCSTPRWQAGASRVHAPASASAQAAARARTAGSNAVILMLGNPSSEGSAMNAKSGARERFELARDNLIELSHRIHAHPELGFEEERASSWLCETLTEAGFSVEKGICNLPTAFLARAGSGPLNIGICAEYDCLPD